MANNNNEHKLYFFPITFFISSKNFDAEAVYGWMMEKPKKE